MKRKIAGICFLALVLFNLTFVLSEQTLVNPGRSTSTQSNDIGRGWDNSQQKVIIDKNGNIVNDGSFDVSESISFIQNGEERTYKNIAKEPRTGNPTTFIIKGGKLSFVNFTTTENTKYKFGNLEVFAPKGANVLFKDGVVNITVPKGFSGVIEKPSKLEGGDDTTVNYKFDSQMTGVKINDNSEHEIKKTGEKIFELSYNSKVSAFLINGEATIEGLQLGKYDPKNLKAYLFFDGQKHSDTHEPYISFGESNLIISSVKDKESPSVTFLPGNNYLSVTSDNFVLMQMNNIGNIVVEKQTDKNIPPKITATGAHSFIFGNQFIQYKEESSGSGGYFTGRVDLTELSGKKSIDMWIIPLKSDGNRFGDWDIITDSKNGIKSGTHTALEQGSISFRNINGKTVVTSSRIGFNQLSEEEQKILFKLPKESQNRLLSLDNSAMKVEIQKIQEEIKKQEEIRKQQMSEPNWVNPQNKMTSSSAATYNSINSARGNPLRSDPQMNQLAYQYSQRMASIGLVHSNMNYAENIAMFSGYGKLTAEQVGQMFTRNWMNSPGHRANILNRGYSVTGVGVYYDQRTNTWWATQIFK